MSDDARSPDRRDALKLMAAGVAGMALPALAAAPVADPAASAPARGERVLRYAFRVAETTFDPAAANDLYSRIVTAHLFEGLYGYDPLARPARIVPRVAEAMPEIEDDFRRWTVRIRPGIVFQDDPAFGGRRRELVAEDFVFAFKRFADPAIKSPTWSGLDEMNLLGLREARQAALDRKKPFDYDTVLPGLRALDARTIRFELAEPRPRFMDILAANDLYGAVAREVVEHYGDNIGAHPVGTGPFRLGDWRRASRIVLVRNPSYRERVYDAEPLPDDAEGQAWARAFKGRRLPMVDRVEVSIIEQPQPRWLSFVQGEADLIDRVPEELIDAAMPGGKLAPHLARRGIRAIRQIAPDSTLTMFNCEDPVVGGYEPARVALRRAIALSVDVPREIQVARHGQMVPADSIVPPHVHGFDPAFKCEMSDHDLLRARALLDVFGWTDRDGDGWRETPEGAPLELELASQSDEQSVALAALWLRNLKALGIRMRVRVQQWPENLKASRAGKLQLWSVSSLSASGDGLQALQRLYGPASGGANLARFKRPEFDRLYERMLLVPDGPEREAMFLQCKRLAAAWMPYKVHGHRVVTDLVHPRLVGYRRPLFCQDFWQYVDVEPA